MLAVVRHTVPSHHKMRISWQSIFIFIILLPKKKSTFIEYSVRAL